MLNVKHCASQVVAAARDEHAGVGRGELVWDWFTVAGMGQSGFLEHLTHPDYLLLSAQMRSNCATNPAVAVAWSRHAAAAAAKKDSWPKPSVCEAGSGGTRESDDSEYEHADFQDVRIFSRQANEATEARQARTARVSVRDWLAMDRTGARTRAKAAPSPFASDCSTSAGFRRPEEIEKMKSAHPQAPRPNC